MFYKNNCTFCSIASYLRTKGYDVTARDTGGKQQMLGGVVESCFKGAKVIDGSAVKFGKSPKDASEMLVNKFGKNASGVVSVQWKKSSPLKKEEQLCGNLDTMMELRESCMPTL